MKRMFCLLSPNVKLHATLVTVLDTTHGVVYIHSCFLFVHPPYALTLIEHRLTQAT